MAVGQPSLSCFLRKKIEGSIAQSDDGLYWPYAYKDGIEMPFVPDGNGPLISSMSKELKELMPDSTASSAFGRPTSTTLGQMKPFEPKKKHMLAKQAKVLYLAKHYYVKLIHIYAVEAEPDQIIFSIIMDRADTKLDSFIGPGKTPEVQCFGCFVDVICYIHGLGIRHRNIKPLDILIKGDNILLADFGISLMGLGKAMPTTYQHRSAVRRRAYCAPKVEKGSTRSRSTDVFSLKDSWGSSFYRLAELYSSALSKNSTSRPSSRP